VEPKPGTADRSTGSLECASLSWGAPFIDSPLIGGREPAKNGC
jgi:hypothetical protein